jgi:hypothetical protein
MDSNRKLTLEDIRRQSLEKWTEAQRRALNEATKNTPVNDRTAAGTGTGSGGSFSNNNVPGIAAQIFFNVSDVVNPFEYIHYNTTTGAWSDVLLFPEDITTSDNLEDYFLTNGYGTSFWYIKDTTSENRVVHVSTDAKILWDSGWLTGVTGFDVDSSDAFGLVTHFIEYGTTKFELVTIYRDIVNTFTFDNPSAGTSNNFTNRLYENKGLYKLTTSDNSEVLYSIDVLTGAKIELASCPDGFTLLWGNYDGATAAAGAIGYGTDAALNCIWYYITNESNDQLVEAKLVDYDGNVLVDIIAQAADQGVDLTTKIIDSYSQFGSGRITGNANNCRLLLDFDDNYILLASPGEGVYFVDENPKPPGGFTYFPGDTITGDVLVMTIEPQTYSSNGPLYYNSGATADDPGFCLIGPSGTPQIETFSEAITLFDAYTDSDNAVTFWKYEGNTMSVEKFYAADGSTASYILSTAEYNINTDSFAVWRSYTPTGRGEQVFQATKSENNWVTTWYINDTDEPGTIHDDPGASYSTYTNALGGKASIIYADTTESPNQLYVIDRDTSTATAYPVQPGIAYSLNANTPWYQSYRETWAAVVDENFCVIYEDGTVVQGSIPPDPTGATIGFLNYSENYLIIANNENKLYYYSHDGETIISETQDSGNIYGPVNELTIISNNDGTTYTAVVGSSVVQSPALSGRNSYGYNDRAW